MKWFILIVVIGLLGVAALAIGTGRLNTILDLIPIELPGRKILPGFGRSETETTKEGETETPAKPGPVATVRRKLGELSADVPVEQVGARIVRRIQQFVPPLKDKKISLAGLNYNLGTWIIIIVSMLVFIRYFLPHFISLGRSGVNRTIRASGRQRIPWPRLNLERLAYGVGSLAAASSALLTTFGNTQITTGTGILRYAGYLLELIKRSGPAFSYSVAAFTALYIFAFMRPIFLDKIREIADLMHRTPRETGGSFAEAVGIFVAAALIILIALVAPPVAEENPEILRAAITPSGESVKAALSQPPTISAKATNTAFAFFTDTLPNFIRLATGNFNPNLVRLWAGVSIIILTMVLGGTRRRPTRRSQPAYGIPAGAPMGFPGIPLGGGQNLPGSQLTWEFPPSSEE